MFNNTVNFTYSLGTTYQIIQLSKSPDPKIRQAVALGCDTPIYVLETLVGDEDTVVRGLLTLNANTPSHILDKLVDDDSWDVRQSAVKHPNISDETLERLAAHGNRAIRGLAAISPYCSDDLFLRLANDDYLWVVEKIAANVETPPNILAHIASMRLGENIDNIVINNPSTPFWVKQLIDLS